MPSLEQDLRLLRLYAFVTYPFACVPFLYLFFCRHGLDQQGFGEVVAVYYVAMFAAEVPTGILADRLGPKPMLVLGPCLLALGFSALVAFPCYSGFVAGEALLGFGHATLSGPPSVMLYESLKRHGMQHRYLSEEARINARRLYGTGGSFLLGGLLAQLGAHGQPAYGATIWLTCALTCSASAIALGLTHRPGRPLGRDLFRGAARSLSRPAVRWLFAYWLVLFALLRYPFHNYQPYLDATSSLEPLHGDPIVVGLLFALMNVTAAPFSAAAPRLVKAVGRPALFLAMPLVLAASFLVMGGERLAAEAGHGARMFAWIGVAMFFVQQVPFGLHTAILQEFVNHRIDSASRTTVLSTISLGARLTYAGCNVLLFTSQQRHGIGSTMIWAGAIGALLALAALAIRPRGLLRGDAG